jgi:hypothetical protein
MLIIDKFLKLWKLATQGLSYFLVKMMDPLVIVLLVL